MYGNQQLGGLPLGDANLGPPDIIVTPSAVSISATAQAPTAAIDAVVAPQPIPVSLLIQPPAVAIDAVVFPDALFVSAIAKSPAVYAPLPIARLRDRARCEPVMLAEVALKNGGPVLRLSDRTVDLLGETYEDYLEDLTGLTEGEGASASVRFKNERFRSYERLSDVAADYPLEGAEVTVRECLLDEGGAPSEAVAVARGVLDAPRGADLAGFSCALLPMESSRDRQWRQPVIDASSWPGAYEDMGEVEPFVYGSGVLVPALRVDWGARTTLHAKIGAGEAALELSDGARFAQSNFDVWVDDEKIHVAARNGNVLSGLTRGYGGTEATAHRAGAEVVAARSQYDSLLAGHELHSVGDVYAEIGGRLWRVASGVSAAFENGKHLLRATENIGLKAIEDGISVVDTIGGAITAERKTTQSGTPSGSFTLNNAGDTATFATFPSAAGANLYEYDLGYNFLMSYTLLTKFQVEAYPTGYPADAQVVIDADGATGLMTSMTTLKSPNHSTGLTFRVKTDQGTNTSCTVYPMRAGRSYLSTGAFSKSGSATKSGTVVATHNVERFHAVVSGAKDPDGNYGGAGSLIERPDNVMKHFLVRKMGFSLDDIDGGSFAEAGAQFAASGYRFAFSVGERITPSEFLKKMARECRSTVGCVKGLWRLLWLADTAPPAIKAVGSGELAGEFSKFVFSRTPVNRLANELTARYRKNYSRMRGDSAWDATASASDAASQAKYGVYPSDMDFEFIRDASMASHVLSHMLLERKAPRLQVEFPVFWERFDLEPGDTVEVENPLYNQRKFLIQNIKRLDKFRAEIRAEEWW